MTDKYNEIELKFAAEDFYLGDILNALKRGGHSDIKIEYFSGRDIMYGVSDDVFIRLRENETQSELTIKSKLRPGGSNINRKEVDIELKKPSSRQDVLQFLKLLLGNHVKEESIIMKSVWVITVPNSDMIYSYYVVNGKDPYFEIEVKKSDSNNSMEASTALYMEANTLRDHGIPLGKRIEKSLREIYKP